MKLVKSIEPHVLFLFFFLFFFVLRKPQKPFQCSPFLSAQLAKEFFKLVEHFQPLLLIISAHCLVWNRNLPHFGQLCTYSFALIPS